MKEQIEDKVIEEMALDLCDKKTKVAIVIVSIDDEGKPRLARSAHYLKNLIEAGYRKQREGEWKYNEYCDCFVCSVCGNSALNNYRGLSVNSNFCPNCGAKMKGGAE